MQPGSHRFGHGSPGFGGGGSRRAVAAALRGVGGPVATLAAVRPPRDAAVGASGRVPAQRHLSSRLASDHLAGAHPQAEGTESVPC